MARFLALGLLQKRSSIGITMLLGLAAFVLPTWAADAPAETMQMKAEATATNAPIATNAPTSNANPKPNALPAPPAPPPVPDTFNRYGKIWAPSDDVAHPLKLNVQFPGVGEMKIPSQDELNIRDKLEQLATLSDDDIRKQLEQWPPYAKMNLRDEGQLLMRIQQFKDQRSKIASDKAHELGLLTLTPPQQARFEKEYWDKRLQMDRQLAKQFEPILKASEQKMQSDLFRDFSAAATAGIPPQSPKPNPPVKPAPTAGATPVAQTPAH